MPQTARVIARIRTFIDCSYGRCAQTDRRSRRSIHIDTSTRRKRGRKGNHRHRGDEKHGKQDQNAHLSLHCLLASMLGEETHGDDHEMARRDEIMSRCICSRTIPCLSGRAVVVNAQPGRCGVRSGRKNRGRNGRNGKKQKQNTQCHGDLRSSVNRIGKDRHRDNPARSRASVRSSHGNFQRAFSGAPDRCAPASTMTTSPVTLRAPSSSHTATSAMSSGVPAWRSGVVASWLALRLL